jgi:hypothetical protein
MEAEGIKALALLVAQLSSASKLTEQALATVEKAKRGGRLRSMGVTFFLSLSIPH